MPLGRIMALLANRIGKKRHFIDEPLLIIVIPRYFFPRYSFVTDFLSIFYVQRIVLGAHASEQNQRVLTLTALKSPGEKPDNQITMQINTQLQTKTLPMGEDTYMTACTERRPGFLGWFP